MIGPSRPGVEHITRSWPSSDLGVNLINPNRTWPGVENGNTVERHSWLIMQPADQGQRRYRRRSSTPAATASISRCFVVRQLRMTPRRDRARRDCSRSTRLMLEPGFDGTLEYALVRAGIPAVTTRTRRPAQLRSPKMVKMGADGNGTICWSHYKMCGGRRGQTAAGPECLCRRRARRVFAGGCRRLYRHCW